MAEIFLINREPADSGQGDTPYAGAGKINQSLTNLNNDKEEAGVAAGLVQAHNSTFDHSKIATALQAEADPVFTASPAAGITQNDINAWNTAGSLEVYGFDTFADFPAVGQPQKIYIDRSTNLIYRFETDQYILLSPESDPVFAAWLATNPLAGYLTSETDPVFAAWLLATPPVMSETDPVFATWLATNPLALFLTEETDPAFAAWLATNPLANYVTTDDSRLSDSRTPISHGNEAHTSTFMTADDMSAENVSFTPVGNIAAVNVQEAVEELDTEKIENIYTVADEVFPIEYLKYSKGGVVVDVTDIPKANGVITGGIVSWLGNLNFAVSPAAYYISGELYTVATGIVTLSAADATNPRIDIIVVDINNQIVVVEGITAENPQKPTPNPETQLELTQILVPAGATEPGGIITNVVIYDENIEWTGSSSGVTVDFNSAVAPFRGTKCADVGSITDNNTIIFTGAAPITASDFQNFVMSIKLKQALTNQQSIRLRFYNNTTPVSSEMILGFNKTLINSWQNITIPISTIPFSSGTFNKIQFQWVRSGGAASSNSGFYLDYIKVETGLQQAIFNTGIELTGDVSGSGTTGTPVPTTLATVFSSPGTFGNASNVPQITIDGKGRITAASNVAIPGFTATTTATLTLLSTGWTTNTQTLTVTGVTATSTNLIVIESIVMGDRWGAAKVYATGQGTNEITFTCDTDPTENIDFKVVILK